MGYQLVEQFVKGKLEGYCEDSIVVSDGFIAVLDGATSKGTFKINNRAPGLVAVEVVEEAIRKLPTEMEPEKVFEQLSEALARYYIEIGFHELLEEKPAFRPTLSIAIYSVFHNEVWMLGDCQCLVGNKTYQNTKAIDEALSALRSYLIKHVLENNYCSITFLQQRDIGREIIQPFLLDQYLYQNSKNDKAYSYSVLDGFSFDFDSVKIVDCSDADEVVLATDGYPKVLKSLTDSEIHLKGVLQDDPLCYKENISTKGLCEGCNSFDDRAYIRFEVVK